MVFDRRFIFPATEDPLDKILDVMTNTLIEVTERVRIDCFVFVSAMFFIVPSANSTYTYLPCLLDSVEFYRVS